MLIKIPLLANASTTTPGDPVLISGRPAGTFFRTASAAYSAGATITVYFDHAETPSGPWEQITQDEVATNQANVLRTFALPGGPFVWMRARLSAAPSAGDLSVNLYVDA